MLRSLFLSLEVTTQHRETIYVGFGRKCNLSKNKLFIVHNCFLSLGLRHVHEPLHYFNNPLASLVYFFSSENHNNLV